MGRLIEASDGVFDTVTASDEWVLVDFWAPWCGPCKMIAPVLEQLSGEREMTIAKVNTDINPLSAGKFGIRGIPALLLFHNGQLVDQQAGAMPKPMFDQWLDRQCALSHLPQGYNLYNRGRDNGRSLRDLLRIRRNVAKVRHGGTLRVYSSGWRHHSYQEIGRGGQ